MSRSLRQGSRSPADLLGGEIFMLKQSRQQLQFQALLAERAHFMRHSPTQTESQLWRELSGKRLGVAFKRQVPVDRYIADFLAPAVKLVVEVDGATHSLRRTADARRDRVLQRVGYRVLRIDAELVRCNLAEAVARVVAALRELA
jgi:very-short-patch-repair endonuclease